jgi:hypothetical protein
VARRTEAQSLSDNLLAKQDDLLAKDLAFFHDNLRRLAHQAHDPGRLGVCCG